jgi:DNA (cytosine-5)-methyltransferase 1
MITKNNQFVLDIDRPWGGFNVIYADPPWKYGSKGVRSGQYGELDYNQMTTKDIAALPVIDIAGGNCALFMWVTGSFIPDALKVGEAWGFKFVRVDKVWAKKKASGKPHAACGPWGMSDAEFIILFVRGQMCSKQIGKRNQYVITEEAYPGIHSGKPAIFRDMITKRFPQEFKRIELFARERVEGWEAFGDQLNS